MALLVVKEVLAMSPSRLMGIVPGVRKRRFMISEMSELEQAKGFLREDFRRLASPLIEFG
jgi:hypothetical protein